MKVPLSLPDITEAERQAVAEVLSTPNLSLGPKLDEFEAKFADYIGTEFAVAVNSGTSGLHLCVRSLGIQDDDGVLTTPFSFVSSANCILFERARPIFVDIDKNSLNIDPDQLDDMIKKSRRRNSRIKAILPVHIFGRPCEMQDIMSLAEKHDLAVIEDACEALGAESLYESSDQRKNWRKVGTFGQCAVFAFYPNKQMTTGEGGMIVTDEESVFKLCRSLRNQGRSEEGTWLQHERLGFNYRISDMNCALGIAQLNRIEAMLRQRERVAKAYNHRLRNVPGLTAPHFEEDKKISWFVYVVRLGPDYSRQDRDEILQTLRKRGIGCSNYFTPIHLQPFYVRAFGYKKGDYPVAEGISERTLALPFYNNLSDEHIEYVCENLTEILQNL